MKLSLIWAFDHIQAKVSSISISDLVARFNKTVAEIEHYQEIVIPYHLFTLVHIETIDKATERIFVFNPELNKQLIVPSRLDVYKDAWYLVCPDQDSYRWVNLLDVGGHTNTYLPALNVAPDLVHGTWRNHMHPRDWIITIDNKSINHRPDLWGHRGFAREIAAMYKFDLTPLSDFLSDVPVQYQEQTEFISPSLSVYVPKQKGCSRFAACALSIKKNYHASQLRQACRLAQIGIRPIDAIVDATNYAMVDLGQPLHAFDSDKLPARDLSVRFGRVSEQVTLLDNTTIPVTEQDLVVCSNDIPIAFAGIMGSKESSITQSTNNIIIEAAHFNAATIRKTSQRTKKRTEASTRFEKSLDPSGIVPALQRTIKILEGAIETVSSPIIVLGTLPEPLVITMQHRTIEQSLGIALDYTTVVDILTRLEFIVVYKDGTYTIQVPTFRATKDISGPHDIVEEIGRSIGYDSIPAKLPTSVRNVQDYHRVYNTRLLKNCAAYGLGMREVATYSFFDSTWLDHIKWYPANAPRVQQPVSAHWQQLVTTLIPNLCQVVHTIIHEQSDDAQIRIFEIGRIWQSNNDQLKEMQVLSGIIANKYTSVNFYQAKALVDALLQSVGIQAQWQSNTHDSLTFWSRTHNAYLYHQGVLIGCVGMLDAAFTKHIDNRLHAFGFELDAAYITQYQRTLQPLPALPKYPSVMRDISMLASTSLTFDHIVNQIKQTDPLIVSVLLLDLFEKKEWINQRSITVRIVFNDPARTLTADIVDNIMTNITQLLSGQGVVIR